MAASWRMQARELKRLDKSLEDFLSKLTAGMGRSERRRWAGVYVRGLLLDGERKSIEPMASRLGESDQDLQHFVSLSPWSADVLLEALAKATATTASAYWIIDETSFPKAGSHSAGVQRQYCGALGKTANCQMAVSLHRADEAAGTSQPLSWRLFLPESWVDDPARCQRAGVPSGLIHHRKQDLALGLLDQALGWKSPTAWRQGTKGPQRSRFATVSLWAAHGWKQGPQPERVEKIALVEWPEGEPAPTRYWLARLPKKRVALAKLVATAKARWRVEQDYRELKDELGLDHFEGRSWQGFHHHLALVTAAFVFLRQEQARLRQRA